MFKLFLSLLLYCSYLFCNTEAATLSDAKGKTWALLAAGSRGYFNYRHQADICHAYQLLKNNGFPDENIITMMYDDIAYNQENPTKGVIVNAIDGPNVYEGVKKDYTGANVTAQNFLNVLSGKKDAMQNIGSGRVIESGPDDYVFVVFVDHGSPGALVFPDGDLHAADLYHTLHEMIDSKKFNKMVLYIEACYSGSVFDNILEDNLDIFVMTAADPRESSYACYYDDYRKTYLGDVFSVNWIFNAEQETSESYSLNHLFEKVRTNTTTSHVEEYGDLDIGNTYASFFIKTNQGKKVGTTAERFVNPNKDAVPSQEVPAKILKKKLAAVNSKFEKDGENAKLKGDVIVKQIRTLYENRFKADELVKRIALEAAGNDLSKVRELEDGRYNLNRDSMHCSKRLLSAFSEKCMKVSENPYITQKLYTIVNMCHVDFISEDDALITIEKTCSNITPLTGVI